MVEIKITWRSLVEPTHSNVHCSLIYASRNAIYFQGETDKVSIKQIKVTQNGLYVSVSLDNLVRRCLTGHINLEV